MGGGGHRQKSIIKADKKSRQLGVFEKTVTFSPQMNEVAQDAALALGKGLPAALIVCVAANWNREGSLAKEGLVTSWHGS